MTEVPRSLSSKTEDRVRKRETWSIFELEPQLLRFG